MLSRLRSVGVTLDVEHVFRVSRADCRFVRGAFKRHGGEPVVVGNKAGARPAVRKKARVKLLLKTAQVPSLVMTGFPRSGEVRLPGVVRHDRLFLAAGALNLQPEDESTFANRPGTVSLTVKKHLRANGVGPRLQMLRQVHGVDFKPTRVARSRPPLDALTVDFQPIAAVRYQPPLGAKRLFRQVELAAEKHEGVLQSALRGVPDLPRRT
jgi:hypothetical protein